MYHPYSFIGLHPPLIARTQQRDIEMSMKAKVTYEVVTMDGRSWFSRNRGGGWRTMIDAETGRATAETCFIEDHRFGLMRLTGRVVAKPVGVAAVAATHRWFTESSPVARKTTVGGIMPWIVSEAI